jgi:hypothetical protein
MLGRIKVTLRDVRRKEHGVLRRYPSRRAPREGRLVVAYNVQVRGHNAILRRDCIGK